jgi:hypothetical protein
MSSNEELSNNVSVTEVITNATISLNPDTGKPLTPQQSDLINTARDWYNRTGLAVIPCNVTIDKTTGLKDKQCNLTKWGIWKTQRQSPEELEQMLDFIRDGKANSIALLMGKNRQGAYVICFDYDTKPSATRTHDAVEIGSKIINELNRATWIENTTNNGEHIFYETNDKLDGKLDYGDQVGLELITDGLVLMAPSPGYIKKGSDLIANITRPKEWFESQLEKYAVITEKVKRTVSKIYSKDCSVNFPIVNLINPDEYKEIGQDEYQGVHPVHGSTNGANFTFNIKENIWYCFRCGKGGTSLHLYAILNGIILCGEKLDGENFKKAIHEAINDNLLPKDAWTKYTKSKKEKDDNKPKGIAGFVVKDRIVELCTDVNGKNYFVHYDRTTSRVIVDEQLKVNFNYDNTEFILPNPKDVVWLTAQTPEPYDSIDDLYADVVNYIYTNVEFPSLILYHIAAAFVLASWRFEDWDYYSYLSFISAYAKGKTRALITLAMLCYRGFVSSSMSTAAMYVMIDKYNPTILLDEIEKLAQDDKVEQIGIINSGYKKGAYVSRTKPNRDGEYDLVHYPVGCPKGFAGTEALKDTLQSRSINFAMRQNTRPIPMKFNEATAQRLRNQLLQYRFTVLGSLTPEDYERFELETANCNDGRIKEICHSLWMTLKDITITCASPKLLSNLESGTFEPIADSLTPKDLLKLYMLKETEQRKDKNIDEYGYRILQSIYAAITTGCMNGKGEIPTQDITDNYNDGLLPKEHKTARTIGKKLKVVWEFEPSTDKQARGIKFDLKKYQRLCEEHNLQYDFSKLKTTTVSNNPAPIQGQQTLSSNNSSPLLTPATIPSATLYYRPTQPSQTEQCKCGALQATVSIVTERGEESFLCQQCFDKSRGVGTHYVHVSQKPT